MCKLIGQKPRTRNTSQIKLVAVQVYILVIEEKPFYFALFS